MRNPERLEIPLPPESVDPATHYALVTRDSLRVAQFEEAQALQEGRQPDETAITRYRAIARTAFSEVVGHTFDDVRALAHRELRRQPADVDDVVQDTYRRAYSGIGNFRGDKAKVSTWLYRITVNTATNAHQKFSRRREELLDKTSSEHIQATVLDEPSPEVKAEQAALRLKVQQALGSLNANYREILVMRDIYDLTHEDIAAQLGISTDVSKVRLHRARKKLKEIIEQSEQAPVAGTQDQQAA